MEDAYSMFTAFWPPAGQEKRSSDAFTPLHTCSSFCYHIRVSQLQVPTDSSPTFLVLPSSMRSVCWNSESNTDFPVRNWPNAVFLCPEPYWVIKCLIPSATISQSFLFLLFLWPWGLWWVLVRHLEVSPPVGFMWWDFFFFFALVKNMNEMKCVSCRLASGLPWPPFTE